MNNKNRKFPAWARGALWTIGAINLVVFFVVVLPWLLRVICSVQTLMPGR